MDILKHGAEVEVITPDFLRQAVKEQIYSARSRMRKMNRPSEPLPLKDLGAGVACCTMRINPHLHP